MSREVRALNAADLAPGEATTVDVDGTEIAVYNVGGEYYATHNECLHVGGPLGDGELDGCLIACPWHGWEYDVRTGVNTFDDELKLRCFRTRVADGAVWIEVGEA